MLISDIVDKMNDDYVITSGGGGDVTSLWEFKETATFACETIGLLLIATTCDGAHFITNSMAYDFSIHKNKLVHSNRASGSDCKAI